jgi:hypothetical protein
LLLHVIEFTSPGRQAQQSFSVGTGGPSQLPKQHAWPMVHSMPQLRTPPVEVETLDDVIAPPPVPVSTSPSGSEVRAPQARAATSSKERLTKRTFRITDFTHIKILSTPKRAARVITKVLINASCETGMHYDEGGLPMLGSTEVREPKFQDRITAGTRALLATKASRR